MTNSVAADPAVSERGCSGLTFSRLLRGSNRFQLKRTLAAAGIDDPHDLEGFSEAWLREHGVGPAGIRAIRTALYLHRPPMALKGEEPQDYPLRVDSLELHGEKYARLRKQGIDTLQQLFARWNETEVKNLTLGQALREHRADFESLSLGLEYPV